MCLGATKFPVCNRADAERIFPSDTRWQRHRTIVEKVHLQGNFTNGRSGSRVLQVTQFFGATGIDKRFDTKKLSHSLTLTHAHINNTNMKDKLHTLTHTHTTLSLQI